VISVKLVVPPGARSTRNPVSFVEASVQLRSICDDETAVALRLVGVAGTPTGWFEEGFTELLSLQPAEQRRMIRSERTTIGSDFMRIPPGDVRAVHEAASGRECGFRKIVAK